MLSTPFATRRNTVGAIRVSLAFALCCISLALAQPNRADAQGLAFAGAPGVNFRVEGTSQQLDMIINTSRILTLDLKVPKALVNNPDIVKITPLSPNQVQVSALKAGVTQVNLWDENENVHSIDVVVTPDGRELERLLKSEFPESALRVRPLAASVVISGFVPRPDMVSRIVRMSEDYYPKVINNMTVGGVQQVALHVKIMEVSRTKLRSLGFDWADINGNDFVVQSVSGLIAASATQTGTATGGGDTVRFGIVNGGNSFFAFVKALRQYNLTKVLAEPTLVTVSGRPASFSSGGEFPIVVPQSLGTVSIEYREFGTRVDFVPIVLGNGNIRLEVRPQVSEIDEARSVTVNDTTVPGLRNRWVDTAVEMKAGQTLALAGLIQTRTEAENRGLPVLSDLPWAGAAFRKVQESTNEVELLIMVQPELIEAVDSHEAPVCGPGESTTHPSDVELYMRGYLEVPKCQGPCATAGNCQPGNCQTGNCRSGSGNRFQGDPYGNVQGGTSYSESQEPAPVMRGAEDLKAPRGEPTPAPRNSAGGQHVAPVRVAPVSTPRYGSPTQGLVRPAPRPAAGTSPQLLGPLGYDKLN